MDNNTLLVDAGCDQAQNHPICYITVIKLIILHSWLIL